MAEDRILAEALADLDHPNRWTRFVHENDEPELHFLMCQQVFLRTALEEVEKRLAALKPAFIAGRREFLNAELAGG